MLDNLIALDARTVTVFLDACFSGLTRQGGSIVPGARPLIIVPDRARPPGVSIYSAASGSQIAHALDEKGHGLFTYLLFRGLGGGADFDGDRRIVAGELKDYLDDLVPRAAAPDRCGAGAGNRPGGCRVHAGRIPLIEAEVYRVVGPWYKDRVNATGNGKGV